MWKRSGQKSCKKSNKDASQISNRIFQSKDLEGPAFHFA